ncbi:MAG: HK97 family phage prohead protease [Ilumatobacteraceae bacterium]
MTEQLVVVEQRVRGPVEFRKSQVTGVDFEKRIIEVIAVPYDEEAIVEHRGQMLRETVAPGAFDGIETRSDLNGVSINRDHDYGRTVGKVVEFRTDDPIGLIAHNYISRTALGDETLQLADDGILKSSVGMVVKPSDQVIRQGARRINRAFLDHIAMLPNPAYQGARVLAVRQGLDAPAADVGPLHTPNLDEILDLIGFDQD